MSNVAINHINILGVNYQQVMAQISCVREESWIMNKEICKLQIMSPQGDDPVFYNPKNEQDLVKVIKTIVEFLNKDYILYGAYSKGTKIQKELRKIADKTDLESVANIGKTLKDKTLDRFLLASKVGKKTLLAPPMRSG